MSEAILVTGGAGYINVPQGEEAPLPGVPDLALRADRAANATGAELLGFTRAPKPLSAVWTNTRVPLSTALRNFAEPDPDRSS